MNGYQGSVLLLSGLLGLFEVWARGIPQNLASTLQTGSITEGRASSFWTGNLGVLLLTIAFVGGATFIAGLSPDAGKLMLAVALAAWLLFLVKNGQNLTSITEAGAGTAMKGKAL